MAPRKWYQFRIRTLTVIMLLAAVGMWSFTEQPAKILGNIHYQLYRLRFKENEIYTTLRDDPIPIGNARLLSPDKLETSLAHATCTYHGLWLAPDVLWMRMIPPSPQLNGVKWELLIIHGRTELPYKFPHPHGDVPLTIEGRAVVEENECTKRAEAEVAIGVLHVLRADEESITWAFTPASNPVVIKNYGRE